MNLLAKKDLFLLDGPMGSEINRRGMETPLPLWSAHALLHNPELVYQIHVDYITAGAEIITTNTFRTQPWTLAKAGFSEFQARELTSLAIDLAKESRKNVKNCLIAGSVSPLEDCYSPSLVPNDTIIQTEQEKHVRFLVEGGIDIILLETFNSFREAKITYELTKEYPDIPVIISFTCDYNGQILSGDSWDSVIQFFKTTDISLLSVNCSSVSGTALALDHIRSSSIAWGFYPNFGAFSHDSWSPYSENTHIHNVMQQWILDKPKLVGTCCGSTPVDIQKIHDFLLQNQK